MSTCFVIMPIGDQKYGTKKISSTELRAKYDHLIKEALLKAKPELEVVRADDVHNPGTITTDILNRIMHSDYVVADITYPNPNVFYELGLRNACRPGTILLKENVNYPVPFDISHLRYTEYENTPEGLKNLAGALSKQFEWFESHPESPDNAFLELAKLTKYAFLKWDEDDAKIEKQNEQATAVMMKVMRNPDLLTLLTDQSISDADRQSKLFGAMASDSDIAESMLQLLASSGKFQLD